VSFLKSLTKWLARFLVLVMFLAVLVLGWHYFSPRPFMTVVLPKEPAITTSFSPGNTLLMVQFFGATEKEGMASPLRFWPVPSGIEQVVPLPMPKESGPGSEFSFLPDGTLLKRRYIEERKVSSLDFIELSTGQRLFHAESADPCAGCLSGDGQMLACLSTSPGEPLIEIWNIAERKRQTTLKSNCPIALSHDGSTLLSHTEKVVVIDRLASDFPWLFGQKAKEDPGPKKQTQPPPGKEEEGLAL
jgi:hypothetical protein